MSDNAPLEPLLERLELAPGEVVGGMPTTVKAIAVLASPATQGVVEIVLATDLPSTISLPPNLQIEPGKASGEFAIDVRPVAEPVTASIIATLGPVSCHATLVVYPDESLVGANGVDAVPRAEVFAADQPSTAGHSSVAIVGSFSRHDLVAASPMPQPPTQILTQRRSAPPLAVDGPPLLPGLTSLFAWKPVSQPSMAASLLGVLPVLPFAALVGILGIYLAPTTEAVQQLTAPLKAMPVLGGIGLAIVGVLIAAVLVRYVFGGVSAQSSNATAFGELLQRIGEIDARLAVFQPNEAEPDMLAAFARAHILRTLIGAELAKPGPQWLLGGGYIDQWRLVHRAEEALLEIESKAGLVAAALYDELRLTGSDIANSPVLLLKLRQAMAQISPAAAGLLDQPPSSSNASVSSSGDTDPGSARAALREIRHTVNTFRDENWAALVRSRNNLVVTMAACGFATLLLLITAMSARPAEQMAISLADPLLSASVFYLVGAIVGLFNRLYAESSNTTFVEDYGLTLARMSLTPVLAGLAAVGGVLLVALLWSGVGGGGLAPTSTAAGASVARSLPSLATIFNLQQNLFGLIIAAIFGLTPHLLISTLQGQADKFTSAISSSAAPSSRSSS